MENKKPIILLFAANSISGLAQGISLLVIPWYFNEVLQNPSLYGVGYAVITFISIFWSSYAGTLVDRFPRRRIFQGLNIGGFVILLSVAVTGFYQNQVPVPLIFLVFASTFFVFNIHFPNLYSLVQEITRPNYYSTINSYLEIQNQLTTAFAGGAAALLLRGVDEGTVSLWGLTFEAPISFEPVSLQAIFALNAATYLIAFSLLTFLRYTPLIEKTTETGSVLKRMTSGFSYLINRPYILAFGILSHNVFVVVLVKLFFLFAMYVHNHLQEAGHIYALSDMFFALGALFAGIFARKLFAGTNTIKSVLVNLLLATLIMFTYVITTWIPLVFFVSFLLGLANSSTRILRVTYLFNHIPNYIIGRVNSVFVVINTFLRMLFIGLFSMAFFAEGNNVIYAYLIFGTFLFVSFVLLMIIYPKLPKN